jgi:hypothetical protein
MAEEKCWGGRGQVPTPVTLHLVSPFTIRLVGVQVKLHSSEPTTSQHGTVTPHEVVVRVTRAGFRPVRDL